MAWYARRVFESVTGTPAVIDRGEGGTEVIVERLARDNDGLTDRTVAVLERLQADE